MPNHIKNVVKFKNITPEDRDMILNMIASITPTEPIETQMIDFNKIIPEPEDESECPDEYKMNKESPIESLKDKPWFDWYEWHIDKWGTKWNAYDGYISILPNELTFVFNTAWTCPMPIFTKLALLGYDMEIEYADEDYGHNCGMLTYSFLDGWKNYPESELDDPVQFAEDLWDKY